MFTHDKTYTLGCLSSPVPSRLPPLPPPKARQLPDVLMACLSSGLNRPVRILYRRPKCFLRGNFCLCVSSRLALFPVNVFELGISRNEGKGCHLRKTSSSRNKGLSIMQRGIVMFILNTSYRTLINLLSGVQNAAGFNIFPFPPLLISRAFGFPNLDVPNGGFN